MAFPILSRDLQGHSICDKPDNKLEYQVERLLPNYICFCCGDGSKGRELLRGLIARAERCAAALAMPFVEARKVQAANALLASADPVAHLEQLSHKASSLEGALLSSMHSPSEPTQQLEHDHRDSLAWDAEPAEAWTLLCLMYDLEARMASKVRYTGREANVYRTRRLKSREKICA